MRISSLNIATVLGPGLSLATMNAGPVHGEKVEKAAACHRSTICIDSDHDAKR